MYIHLLALPFDIAANEGQGEEGKQTVVMINGKRDFICISK